MENKLEERERLRVYDDLRKMHAILKRNFGKEFTTEQGIAIEGLNNALYLAECFFASDPEEDRAMIDALCQENEKLHELIREMRRGSDGGCWCMVASGHPLSGGHSATCSQVQQMAKEREEIEKENEEELE